MTQQVPIPEEPLDLTNIRMVTVLAAHSDNWAIEIEYVEEMSPYEAYAMLDRATAKIRFEIDALNIDLDGETEPDQ